MTLLTVVIPTYRRPNLVKRTVISVLQQTYQMIEVLIVIDGEDDGTAEAIASLADPRARVIATGINRGPAMARNAGVAQAKGQYIAILDDDDEWIKTKLESQLRFVQDRQLSDSEFLLSCRTVAKNLANGKIRIWPHKLFENGDLGDYLLDRGSPFGRPGLISSGTLFFPKRLAERVPFPDDSVHEDWSWLLLCVVRDRVPLYMDEQAMFIYNIDDGPSRNRLMNWHDSLEWGQKYRAYLSGRAFAGLLSSTTAWRAKQHGGWRAFFEIASVMHREGQATLLHWLTLIGVMLFPMKIAEKLRLTKWH